MTPEREKLILAASMTVLLFMLIYRVMNPYEQQAVKELKYPAKSQEKAAEEKGKAGKKEDPADEIKVMLQVLRHQPEHSGEVISPHFFQAIPGISPVAAAPDLANEAEPEKQAEPDFDGDKLETASGETPDALTALNEMLNQLKVIGVYSSGADRAIFFQRDKQSIIARKGDRLDGKYLVEEITADEVVFKADQVEERVRLSLVPFLNRQERNAMQ